MAKNLVFKRIFFCTNVLRREKKRNKQNWIIFHKLFFFLQEIETNCKLPHKQSKKDTDIKERKKSWLRSMEQRKMKNQN